VQPDGTRALLAGLLLLLTVGFYPALFQGRRIAPEASLRAFPPWRVQSGPVQSPSPLAVAAALGFGARLQMIVGHGDQTALWNPWVGGGRAGWLAGPDEGGTPLALLAASLARRDNVWTALLALTIGMSFAGAFWLASRLGADAVAAALGGIAYALSGAAATAWLGPDGSAVALGPVAIAIVSGPPTATFLRHLGRWAAAAALLAPCGRYAIPFVALALAVECFRRPGRAMPRRLAAALLALAAALLAVVPSGWLEHASREDGAAVHTEPVETRRNSPTALVEPFPDGDSTSGPATVRRGVSPRSGAAFVGAPVVLLALAGAASASGAGTGVWIAAALATGTALFAPIGLPRSLVEETHNAPIMALSLAMLAAFGATSLCRALPGRWRSGVGTLLVLTVMARSASPALHRMPYAFPADARLTVPLLPEETASGSRFLGLVGALPPDVSAALAIPDVRAAALPREPRYAAALGIRDDQSIPLSRVDGSTLGKAGVRWILEPLPLNVLSGELFSRVEIVAARVQPGAPPRMELDVPAGTGRIGLQLSARTVPMLLHSGNRVTPLVRESSLDPESDIWRWFAFPPAAGTAVTLLLPGAEAPEPTVAVDTSRIRVAREGAGLRVWLVDDARPFVSFAADGEEVATGAGLECAPFRPRSVECTTDSGQPGRVVALVKYRPRLWQASVDGRHVSSELVDGLWTSVPVPPGRHTVSLRARVPARVLAVGGTGICSLLLFLWFGRRR
jgi:hypothetical protein